ncbi:site-specific integrase [Metabacillus schmidteae]|uniref:site-specific integrase n=1 Tax=Metabacillus schmidteae TaxID=2730405 RepID=UPI00158F33A9|nr:site-specific integrase [Metabacillus schmidteae]
MNPKDRHFCSRLVKSIDKFGDRYFEVNHVQICIHDKDKDIIYGHPLSHFIYTKYDDDGKKLNTAKKAADIVCRFLNYVYKKAREGHDNFKELKSKGITGLTRLHGAEFITSKTYDGLEKKSVMDYESCLNRFYDYLKEFNYIEEEFEVTYVIDKKGNTVIETSIFSDPKLRRKLPNNVTVTLKNKDKDGDEDKDKGLEQKRKDFGDDRYYLTQHFIQIARALNTNIALGLCLQFYGGLRLGEVINVTRKDLDVALRKSMEVQVKDNRKLLFSRLKDITKLNPKRLSYLKNNKMAKQTILDNDLVWEVYEEHIKWLDKNLHKMSNPQALFIDDNGNPMSGKVYEKRFNRVKKFFLDSIKDHPIQEDLEKGYWNSHICRGVFTHFLIGMNLTITQIAIARGDKSIDSVFEYIDDKFSQDAIKQALKELKKVDEKEFGLISDDIKNDKWRPQYDITHRNGSIYYRKS